MRTLVDCDNVLGDALASIREQYQLPQGFPAEIQSAAEEAARRPPTEHVDRTSLPFVTLDPATATDLDQAFAIEPLGADWLLHYAIADVGWFVDEGSPLDREAWVRGASQYLPDGKVPLYPPVLSEGAASLLPDGPRPAIILSVRVAPDGAATLAGCERALIRSRAKLAYETVRDEQLPTGFADLADRIVVAEEKRGAARVDPPEQEVERRADQRFVLRFRARTRAEERNAALSLAANLAVAQALLAHRTGLFRVMPQPEGWAVRRLHHTAKALGLEWPRKQPLAAFAKQLDPADARDAAFMLAERRASPAASYVPFEPGIVPHHAAMAATYAHATAPLRRLADRYVLEATLAVANGRPVPPGLSAAFALLPAPMAKADMLGGQLNRAVIDLAEAVMLSDRVGETFDAVATDTDPKRGTRFQLCALPVVARIGTGDIAPGQRIRVRLIDADPDQRRLGFERVD